MYLLDQLMFAICGFFVGLFFGFTVGGVIALLA
jgi:hypothetical protein